MKQEDFKFIAEMIADKTGVTFKAGNGWSANVIDKVITYPKNMSIYLSDVGYLIHEASHLRYSKVDEKFVKECEELIKSYGKNGMQLHYVVNFLEDIRVDNKICNVYRGAKIYLDYNEKLIFNNIYDNLWSLKMLNPKKFNDDWHKNKIKQYTYSSHILNLDIINEIDKESFIFEMINYDVKIISEKTLNIIKNKIHKLKNTDDVVKFIIEELLNYILPLFDEFDKQEEKDEKRKEEEHKKLMEKMKEMLNKLASIMKSARARVEKAEKTEKDEKNGKAEKAEKDGKAEKTEKDGKGEKNNNIIKLQRGERIIGDDDNDSKKCNSVFDVKSYNDINNVNNIFLENYEDSSSIKLEELIKFVNSEFSKVRKSVSIIKDLEYTRFQGGFDSGKIEQRKIKKLFTGYNRIFQRKVDLQNDNHDMAIAILVDESGSMRHNDKNIESCKAVGVLSKALQSAGKAFAIYGFNREFHIHKNWNKKVNFLKILEVNSNTFGESCGSTNDGYAIWKTSQELKKRPEKNKIIIVFSDGKSVPDSDTSPEGKKYYDYQLTKEVKKAEKIAKVYSFGICDDTVKNYYKRYKILYSASDLSKEMIKIFKEYAGKRKR